MHFRLVRIVYIIVKTQAVKAIITIDKPSVLAFNPAPSAAAEVLVVPLLTKCPF